MLNTIDMLRVKYHIHRANRLNLKAHKLIEKSFKEQDKAVEALKKVESRIMASNGIK